LNDQAIGTSVDAAYPSNPSFPTHQPDSVLSFATGYSSTRQIGLCHELTKSLASKTVPNHQEILATPPSKKKKQKKKKDTPVPPIFYEATHSSVSP
jgi:hypothetical protein